MTSVGLQYEPVNLDVNKVSFGEEEDIPNTREKSGKSHSVTEYVDVRNEVYCTQMLST